MNRATLFPAITAACLLAGAGLVLPNDVPLGHRAVYPREPNQGTAPKKLRKFKGSAAAKRLTKKRRR